VLLSLSRPPHLYREGALQEYRTRRRHDNSGECGRPLLRGYIDGLTHVRKEEPQRGCVAIFDAVPLLDALDLLARQPALQRIQLEVPRKPRQSPRLDSELVGRFSKAAGVGYWAHNFTHDQITSQLKEQQIVFPAASSPAIKALPAADASAMKQYAGQSMLNGYQAQTYANHFIAVHLRDMGMTYSQASAVALNPTTPKAQAAKANALALTLFRGETLRSLLLNAWAFWFVGDLALYAAIGLTLGAVIVFLAFLFELLVVPRREGVVQLSGRRGTVTAS